MLLVLGGGLPGVVVACVYLWSHDFTPEVRWTLGAIVIGVWIGAASAARELAIRSLNLIANLLGALREGDYSIRGLSARAGSSMALVTREVNDLGTTLQRQRTEAVESTALLSHVMEEIAVAVFAFDPTGQLLLVNKGGEQLLMKSREELVGLPASALEFEEYLTGEPRKLTNRAFGGRRGRYEVRRAVFYRDGRPHQLVVLADLSQALREEEQAAWQRIVRVLSHEINNSLTPIKSIAHSLKRIIDRAAGVSTPGRSRPGTVAHRGSIGRARSFPAIVRAARETAEAAPAARCGCRSWCTAWSNSRSACPSRSARPPTIRLLADSDQLEQLLINIVRNAVDASLETGGGVSIGWKQARRLARGQRRRRGQGPLRHVESVRAVLHDQTQRVGHRSRAEPPDRRSARRDDLVGEPHGRVRVPGDAEIAGEQ